MTSRDGVPQPDIDAGVNPPRFMPWLAVISRVERGCYFIDIRFNNDSGAETARASYAAHTISSGKQWAQQEIEKRYPGTFTANYWGKTPQGVHYAWRTLPRVPKFLPLAPKSDPS